MGMGILCAGVHPVRGMFMWPLFTTAIGTDKHFQLLVNGLYLHMVICESSGISALLWTVMVMKYGCCPGRIFEFSATQQSQRKELHGEKPYYLPLTRAWS